MQNRKIIKMNQVTDKACGSLVINFLPLQRGMALHLDKLESPLPRFFMQSLVEIDALVPKKVNMIRTPT